MSQIIHNSYSASRLEHFPRLFSSTENFSFFSRSGQLNHAFLPSGPKRYEVVRVATTGHRLAMTESNRCALTIQINGSAEVKANGKSFTAKAGDITLLRPGHRHSTLNPSNGQDYISYTVLAPADAGHRFGCPETASHRRDPRQHAVLSNLLTFAFDFLSDPVCDGSTSRVRASVEALIEEVFRNSVECGSQDFSHVEKSHRYDVIVSRARDYIAGSYSEPISVYDIAQAAGTTIRTLQNATQSRLGAAPRALLTEFRLDKMRAGLTSPDDMTSVTSAAHDAGLFHLGRTSIIYRQRFGELPSATLRRSIQ